MWLSKEEFKDIVQIKLWEVIMDNNNIIEIGKMLADLLKLIATLATGMIGLVITIIEKVFTPRRIFNSILNKLFVSLTLIAFIASLVLSILGLIVIPSNVNEIINNTSKLKWVDDYSFYGSIGSFVFGVILFVIVSILSFQSSTTDTGTTDDGSVTSELGPVGTERGPEPSDLDRDEIENDGHESDDPEPEENLENLTD